MLRRVAHHFVARLGGALGSLGVVWLTARYLGAAGRGQVSLFVTDTAALLLFTGLLGGSSLIYLVPRRNVWHLLAPAYGWALVVCGLGATLAGALRGGWPYGLHLAALAGLQALLSINLSLLLGRGHERLFNLLTTGQVLLLAVALAAALALGYRTVPVFYYASYLAYAGPLLLSTARLWQLPDVRRGHRRRRRATARELARHSRGAHFSNIIVFANYRLGYYVVAYLLGAPALGVLSVGVAVAEGLWLIARSTSLIQYVALVRAPAAGQDRAGRALGRMGLAVLGLTALGAVVLAAIPAGWLAGMFGPAFAAARPVLWALAPGIVANAGVNLVSTYFAAQARYGVNNCAAGLGLLIVVPLTVGLVPRLGIVGAALAMSASYLTSAGYLFWQLRRQLAVVRTAAPSCP